MSIIVTIFSVLVALEFLYIFYLETIATTFEKTSKVVGMSHEEFTRDSVKTLFKNQGVYNALIAVLILIAVVYFRYLAALRILMVYIILVACYGSLTSNKKIIIMQGGLHIVTLIASFLAKSVEFISMCIFCERYTIPV